jgi:hypothetical protein
MMVNGSHVLEVETHVGVIPQVSGEKLRSVQNGPLKRTQSQGFQKMSKEEEWSPFKPGDLVQIADSGWAFNAFYPDRKFVGVVFVFIEKEVRNIPTDTGFMEQVRGFAIAPNGKKYSFPYELFEKVK